MSEPKANIADRSEQEWAQRERFNQDWQQPTLGRVDRLCTTCGQAWDNPSRCQSCGAHAFTETAIPAVPVEIGPLGRLKRAIRPEKPAPVADPADLEALERLRLAGEVFLLALAEADQAARRIVNSGAENYGFTQAKLAMAATAGGDVDTRNLVPLAGLVRTLNLILEEAGKPPERTLAGRTTP